MSSSGGGINSYIGRFSATVAAAAAIAAAALALPAVTGNGSGDLPSGVSLVEVDGGADYFAQWSSSFPSDASFFPIGVFNEFTISSKAADYQDMGINTFVGLFNGPLDGSPDDIQVADTLGMYTIISPAPAYIDNSTFKSTWGSTAAAWVYQDEAENNSCAFIGESWLEAFCTPGSGKPATSSFAAMTNQVHTHDANRPVYNGFTNGFVFDWFLNGSAAQLASGSDIIGYDVYPMVDRRSTFGGELTTGRPWGTYETVALAREHAGNAKPVWPDIETSEVDTFNSSCYRPTGADVQALVMNAIVAGARGITYFNSNFASNCSSPTMNNGVLRHASFSDIRTAVTEINGVITNLAPVLNSDFADGYVSVTGGSANVMAKWAPSEDAFYVFAVSHSTSSQTVTFSVAGTPNVTATVLNESRSRTVTSGTFTDTVSGQNAFHIYKIPNG